MECALVRESNQIDLLVSGISLEGWELDHSPFRPQTATRSADQGTIQGNPLVDVRTALNGQTVHRPQDENLLRLFRLGDWVSASLDLEHRAQLDRLDSLGHIVHFAVAKIHGAAHLVKRSIGPNQATVVVEVDSKAPIHETATAVQRWVEAVIRDDITIHNVSLGTVGRNYWQVDGVGCVPSETTHPASTGRIGSIQVSATRDTATQLRFVAR